nr:MAG TPA_asm: hypothetical protein [Caudoviricetes sp.]
MNLIHFMIINTYLPYNIKQLIGTFPEGHKIKII